MIHSFKNITGAQIVNPNLAFALLILECFLVAAFLRTELYLYSTTIRHFVDAKKITQSIIAKLAV